MAITMSLFPIILLVWLMTKKNNMPSFRALPLVALLLYAIKLIYFDIDANLVNATVVSGLLTAWVPISIVFGAIFLFKTMEYTGAMDTIRTWLNGITTNKVAQAMIIAWAFAFLIEGASGFGTPAAIAAPILVGLGFKPVRVAILCLIMNSVPVHFGAVGTPGWFGLGKSANLTDPELLILGQKAALMHASAALVIPVIALVFALEWKVVRRNIVFVYLSIFATIIPYLVSAWFSYEFPSVVAGAVGTVCSIFFALKGWGLNKIDGETVRSEIPLSKVAFATFPLWGTVALLLITRIKPFGINALLKSTVPFFSVDLGGLGDLAVSKSLVINLGHIFGTGVGFTYQLLYIPCLIPFILVSLIAFVLFKAKGQVIRRVTTEAVVQMKNPTLALLGALVFVKLLMLGTATIQPSTLIIGSAFATLFGGAWSFLAAYLGALGAFFSGSNTVSNLTFGGIQASIATELGLDKLTVLAMQSVGGGMGNMVCIHNIVAVCSVLGLSNSEGFILKRTVIPLILYGLIVGAVGSVLLRMA
jgi:lactate permease